MSDSEEETAPTVRQLRRRGVYFGTYHRPSVESESRVESVVNDGSVVNDESVVNDAGTAEEKGGPRDSNEEASPTATVSILSPNKTPTAVPVTSSPPAASPNKTATAVPATASPPPATTPKFDFVAYKKANPTMSTADDLPEVISSPRHQKTLSTIMEKEGAEDEVGGSLEMSRIVEEEESGVAATGSPTPIADQFMKPATTDRFYGHRVIWIGSHPDNIKAVKSLLEPAVKMIYSLQSMDQAFHCLPDLINQRAPATDFRFPAGYPYATGNIGTGSFKHPITAIVVNIGYTEEDIIAMHDVAMDALEPGRPPLAWLWCDIKKMGPPGVPRSGNLMVERLKGGLRELKEMGLLGVDGLYQF